MNIFSMLSTMWLGFLLVKLEWVKLDSWTVFEVGSVVAIFFILDVAWTFFKRAMGWYQ